MCTYLYNSESKYRNQIWGHLFTQKGLKRKNLFYKRTHEAEEVKNFIYVDIKSFTVDINSGKVKYKFLSYTIRFRVVIRDDGRRI